MLLRRPRGADAGAVVEGTRSQAKRYIATNLEIQRKLTFSKTNQKIGPLNMKTNWPSPFKRKTLEKRLKLLEKITFYHESCKNVKSGVGSSS